MSQRWFRLNSRLTRGVVRLSKGTERLIAIVVLVMLGLSSTLAVAEAPLVSNIFQETYIIDALNDISVQTGIPIVVDSSVSGFISAEFIDVPLEQALARICVPYGYTFKYMDDEYYLIGPAEPKTPTFPILSETGVVKMKHLKADTVSKLLSDAYKPYIKADGETNTITVTASPQFVERILKDISEIDAPIRQVMLEVLVTELSTNARKALGTDWQWDMKESTKEASGIIGFAASTLVSTLGFTSNGTRPFLMSLKALVEKGEARVHANPKIVTLDGKPAEVFLGDEQTYIVLTDSDQGSTVTRQRVIVKTGVNLKFLPYISPDGEITLTIEPEVSSTTGLNRDGFPIVSSRKASTTIRVRDGETFILGGLIHQSETNSVGRVPILGDLPLLGKLFRSERFEIAETEVVIMVTPVIIGEGVE